MKVRLTRKAVAQIDQLFEEISSSRETLSDLNRRLTLELVRLAGSPDGYDRTDIPGLYVLHVGLFPYLVFFSINGTLQEVHVLAVRPASTRRSRPGSSALP